MPPKLKIKAVQTPAVIDETPTPTPTPPPPAPTAPLTQFLSSLSPLERRVCEIAESHLQSSFDLSRSSGYIAWKAKNGVT
jgi:hypothetical protein